MQFNESAGDRAPSGQGQSNESGTSPTTAASGAGRSRRGRGVAEKGAPPSNTAPHTCNDIEFLPLRWGVDSLYLSYAGELLPEVAKKLASLKQLAQSVDLKEEARAQLLVGDHLMEVKDKGVKLFPYILADAAYWLQLSKGTGKSPMAYCQVSSGVLAFKTPSEVEAELSPLLGTLGELQSEARVSRIDLYVDFCANVAMDGWDRHAWVTRAKYRGSHAIYDDFSGWSIGMGGVISARLYNKTLEIIESGKEYLHDLWRQVGWDGKRPVWRLELQLERELLTQFGLSSLPSVTSALGGLWSYGVTEWLRLTIPNPSDKTRSRWPLHPLWIAFASVDWEENGGPLVRSFDNRRVPSLKGLCRQALATLTSRMALDGQTAFWDGWNQFGMDVYGQLATDGAFEGVHADDLLVERIRLKGRKFNSIHNFAMGEADAHAKRVADEADEYRRRSGR